MDSEEERDIMHPHHPSNASNMHSECRLLFRRAAVLAANVNES